LIEPRLFFCNGHGATLNHHWTTGRKVVELSSFGPSANVNIRIEDVARAFLRHLSARLVDLVEIASFVYAADCSTRRGSDWSDQGGVEAWGRDFHFVINVRDLDFWRLPKVQESLKRSLGFLSDDKYEFDFEKLHDARPVQEYLDFGCMEKWPFHGVDRVVMFSGGLDSLAGAAEMACNGEKLVLVSHRSVATLSRRQKELFDQLRTLYSVPMLHVPVWINKAKNLGREHTQRTRAFLYSALGAVVAKSVGAKGVRFFENGVVSLNLPVADEALRARASRTTHPLVLNLLSEFYSEVMGSTFALDNPYVFSTKADVVNCIAKSGAAELIRHTCSCAHTGYFQSGSQWHCGTCSQCIDRRVAIVATGMSEYDPESDYVSDVFVGDRKPGYEQNMAVDYARHGLELWRMAEEELASNFSLELSRAAYPFEKRRDSVQRFIQMHKRHGDIVHHVLQAQIELNSARIISGDVASRSLIGVVMSKEHLISSWKRLANRICELLSAGIPIACQTHKPTGEPHLQELCDGILAAHVRELVREFPFMRWSSSLTKPDWSTEGLLLWVELKYARAKRDIRAITEDIAADITKYGDNQRRTLFVIYDPEHVIIDEGTFSEPIRMRPTMEVTFIR
jgi:hypothetical protein